MTQELFGDIGRRSSDDIGQNQGGVSFRAVGGQLCANRIGNGSRICIGGYIHRAAGGLGGGLGLCGS